MMKKPMTAALLALMMGATHSMAFNQAHVDQLRATKSCVGCDLTGAELTGANLTDADLTDADLTGAELYLATLTNANLTNANLTNANLHNSILIGIMLCNTVWTDGRIRNDNC